MRPILRLLGTRYGIALVLLVLVLGIVAVFRAVAGPSKPLSVAPPLEPSRSVSVAPFDGDDGVGDDDANPTPSASGPSADDAIATATHFSMAWLKHSGVTAEAWRAGMKPYATTALLTKLADADPAGVPADRIAGDVKLVLRDAGLAEATVPVDSGTLRLRLVTVGTQWKVDAVDWERPT